MQGWQWRSGFKIAAAKAVYREFDRETYMENPRFLIFKRSVENVNFKGVLGSGRYIISILEPNSGFLAGLRAFMFPQKRHPKNIYLEG